MSTNDLSSHTPPGTHSPNSRLDRIPVATKSQKIWVTVLGLFFVFETIDLAIASYTAPAWRVQWGASISALGAVTASTFVGMAIGAVIGGRISDRIGRKPVLLGAMALMSLATLATAFAANIEQVTILRVIAGLGLQAMVGTVVVYASELLPQSIRGRYVSLVVTIGMFAVPVAAILATVIIPLADGAWRWLFVLASLGVLLIVPAARILPESPRWLATRGRDDEALAIVTKLEKEAEAATQTPLPTPVEETAPASAPLRGLIARNQVTRTFVAVTAMVCMVMLNYGFASWIPTFLVDLGLTQTQSLTYSTVMAVLGALGSLTAFFFIDRFERKHALTALAVALAVIVTVFGFTKPIGILLALGLVCIVLVHGIWALVYTFVPEVFPTGLRGVGTGLANGLGRAAGIGGSFIVPALYGSFGFSSVYLYVAAVCLVLALVVGVYGPRTRGVALE